MIDREKLVGIVKGRKELKNDYSCVIKGEDNLGNYKKVVGNLNGALCALFGGRYEPYGDNLHVTAMGLEGFGGLSKEVRGEILAKIGEFPDISPSVFNLEILDNGLLVCQMFFEERDREKLKEWRRGFSPYGFVYKHEEFLHKMHSVVGNFNPDLEMPSKRELSVARRFLSEAASVLGSSDIGFSEENVNLYLYKYTSFAQADIVPRK